MSDGDDYPVALLYALAHIGPKAGVEGAAAHSAESLVFNSDFVLVEELLRIISPSPLSVVAVAQRAVAHGGVSDEEEHGVVALAACSGRYSCGFCLVKTVEGVVHYLVYILHGFCHLCKSH